MLLDKQCGIFKETCTSLKNYLVKQYCQQKNNTSSCAGKPSGNFLVTGTNVKAQLGPSVGTRRTPHVIVSQSI